MDDFWSAIFSGEDYGAILALVRNSVIAAALLGIVGGLIGVFVMQRDMAFAVHGISEISFAGAAGALLLGLDVVGGSIVGALAAAAIIGLLGVRARDRNSIVGVLMPFGLGLGILFLALYPGRSANQFGLLTGQIIAVDLDQLWLLVGITVAVLVTLLVIWRPLVFDSADPVVAEARGVPTRGLSLLFMLLLGLTVAVSVQIIGVLLVLALLITPAAAALRVSSSPVLVPVLSMAFGLVSALGGVLLAVGGSLPISPYITTISFLIYLVCRVIAAARGRAGAASGPAKLGAPAAGASAATGGTAA